MKKLRYLIAAALIAGSMAVCAGAVRTVTPQEALQSSITQVQQQWQNENDKSMYFIDGDGYGGYASPLVPSKNLYTISLDIDGYIKYGFLDGVVNIETGEMVIPLEYDTIDVLADNKILLSKEILGKEHCSDFYLSDENGNITPMDLPVEGICMSVSDEGYFFVGIYAKRPLTDVIYYQEPTTIQYDIPKLVLFDENMNMLRDDIDGGVAISTPVFHNGLMAIQTGSTLWEGSVKGAYGNGKYGLIDKTGKFVSKNDFDKLDWQDNRYIGKRGTKLYLVDKEGGETELPSDIDKYGASWLDKYSTWARPDVAAAHEHGLGSIFHYPRLDITRVDFCELAVNLYSKMSSVPENIPDAAFSDCEDENVAVAAALGIVTGYEDGTFRPYAFITREEAATMLNRLYKSLGGTETVEGSKQYADDARFGDWSRDSIYTMQNIGIMKGEENNEFHPDGGYTGEQAIVTIERMYNRLTQ
ncbi:S-layer homology domain-containing protein [Agathobaculum hominis]|uniref:S-layer homology domain-containing protein n=1 Tax=Agathobaculum hominis TaxID=2763014 RepID=A0ABR7GJY1_9FIRM|nr:S-layer homology domain-containing protein [Agathobaculum hominis]MBC5694629.1 S-layer homology domain-containing protein [Agathobaculum hominis]